MCSSLRTILIAGLALIFMGACASEPPPPTQADISLETLVAEIPLTQNAAASLTPNTPTVTVEPTPTETLIPTATFTLAPTLTPTRPPDDPRWRFGDPDWTDTFDNANNWSPYSSERASAEIRDGKFFYNMVVNDNRADRTVSWPVLGNFYLEVTAQTPAECSGKDRYGVMFRAPNPDEGYLFNFSCDGHYRLVTIDRGGLGILTPWTIHDAIIPGPNQINRFGIWASRRVIQIYANGIPLAGIPDEDTYLEPGRFGLSVAAENTPNFTVAFDNLNYWSIP